MEWTTKDKLTKNLLVMFMRKVNKLKPCSGNKPQLVQAVLDFGAQIEESNKNNDRTQLTNPTHEADVVADELDDEVEEADAGDDEELVVDN